MPAPITLAPMAQSRQLMPLVGAWFRNEWPGWYGPGGAGDLGADLAAFSASETVLPVGLIAFLDGQPVGAAALKATSIASHVHLSPWAAAGFVLAPWRGRGIGAALLQGLVAKAGQLGHAHVYCGTSTSASLLLRGGWEVIDVVTSPGDPLTIFRCRTS